MPDWFAAIVGTVIGMGLKYYTDLFFTWLNHRHGGIFRYIKRKATVKLQKGQHAVVIVYEGGQPVAKWKLRPAGEGTDIEQTTLKGVSVLKLAHNLALIMEGIVGDMWRDDVVRLIMNLANDVADEELEEQQRLDDELPF